MTSPCSGVLAIRNGERALPAMLSAIERARRIVRIEMYWWGRDPVGDGFREAITAAARRGVDVLVVVDGFGSAALPDDYFDELRRVGGRAHVYRPLGLAALLGGPRAFLGRTHRKVVVADGEAFLGGLNLALPWATLAQGGQDWRDTVLSFKGESVADHLASLVERTALAAPPDEAGLAWVAPGVGIVTNSPATLRGRKIRATYLDALRGARSSIDLTNPYFAPRPVLLASLVRAVRRGVRARVLVPLTSDVELARLASMPFLRWLAARGVKVYRYGGAILHAKSAVIDGETSIVGSHNLDGLSWAWNLECNAIVKNRDVAADLTAMFEQDLCLSVELTRHERAPDVLERLVPDAIRSWYQRGR